MKQLRKQLSNTQKKKIMIYLVNIKVDLGLTNIVYNLALELLHFTLIKEINKYL